MLTKILTIAYTNIYITFSDRGALVLMLLIPVALSTLIGVAFGRSTNEINLEPAQVMVINQDVGGLNLGAAYIDVLTENNPAGLGQVLTGEIGSDFDTARQMVKDGDLSAVIIIPSDFSQQVQDAGGAVDVYYNPGNRISATIVLAVVRQISAQLGAGVVGQELLLGEPPANFAEAINQQDLGYWIKTAIGNGEADSLLSNIQTITQETLPALYRGAEPAIITVNKVSIQGKTETFDSLQYFAPSMAIFFMTFAMAAGARSILEENTNWTLQRLLTTPTPRWVYMVGKLLGTYLTGVLQMLILLVVTPLTALLLGRGGNVWGENYAGVALVTLAVVAASTGLGLLLTAISKTPRQADNYASAVLVVMAMLSGTFIPTESVSLFKILGIFTLNKWGLDGYTDLAANAASVEDILPNVGALLAMGAVFFAVALWRFNRRLDI